jgi:hypothetical protein
MAVQLFTKFHLSFRLAEPQLAASGPPHQPAPLACRAVARILTNHRPPSLSFRRGSLAFRFAPGEGWRRGRDSNPRRALTRSGFQDRRDRPLCHLSDRRLACRAAARCFHPAYVSSPPSFYCGAATCALASLQAQAGTAGGNRTPNQRFWRPLLCQLSYCRNRPILFNVTDKNGGGKFIPALPKLKTPQAMTSVTRPAPIVRPPSRIAKR